MDFEFNGAELRLARIFNRLALEDVAEKVGKTRQYLHKLETGQGKPTEQLLNELATELRVEPAFLTTDRALIIGEHQFHFRKLLTTRAMVKQEAMAHGQFISRLVASLEDELKFPVLKIPQVDCVNTFEDIERAAELCRREWGLGLGPIAHMSRLAENIGVVVTSFQSVSKDIDALSLAVKRPIIVRNEAKESVCRQRFDIGHELGHFVLHEGLSTGDRVTESQANRFASALLIPRTMMAKLFPKPRGARLDWLGISEFKLTWKVSKAAILYRARQLELISDDQYKSGVITLRRTGEAIVEREDNRIAPELPELLSRSLTVLAEKKAYFAEEISALLRVTPSLLRDVVGFDLPTRSASERMKKRPDLYLVA
jgi:Zn-dependent peptidase ImmA (M78 family)/transcriptional regulator with XRE-family HTH domain